MSSQTKRIFEFGPFRLDAEERVLLRDGRPESLSPKAIELLLALVERSGHIVEKDELMNRVWGGSFVEEGNLKVTVSVLRKALEQGSDEHQYIETVPRRGYRFVDSVKQLAGGDADVVMHQVTRSTLTIEQQEETPVALAGKRNVLYAPVTIAAAAVIALMIAGYFLLKGRTEPGVKVRSVAVLPFKPLVENNRDEALEMGMADTLITRLSNIKQIIVRPMSAVRNYDGLNQDAVAAGREQKVDAVVDGSIQKSGDQIRVTVRVWNVGDGQQLWSGRFDERFIDIFTLQDSISRKVADALAAKLTSQEQELLTKHHTDNTKSYQLYLLGRYYWGKRTEDGLKKGVEYFKQSIEEDPHHALAYADLTASYKMFPYYGVLPASEAHPKAKEAATKALEIDETLAEAHAARAAILECSDLDWSAAEEEFRRSIELKPNYAAAHHWYGLLLERMGRLEEAKAEMVRASELDPVSLIISKNMGDPFFYMRHYDEAIEQYRKTLELDPNFFLARLWLGKSYEQKGMYKEAITEFQNARSSDDNAAMLSALGHVYAVSGNKDGAEKIIIEVKGLSKRYVSPYHIAIIYAGLQKNDEAFELLEEAYQGRDEWLLYLKIDPRLDNLRADRRFANLLGRLGLAQ